MGIPDLYTLANRPKPNLQKSAQPSRLQVKAAKVKDDERQLREWRDQVFERDDRKCRCCGVRVIRLQVQILHPRRAEAHHIAGRDDQAVRTDTRNGLTLCLLCHQRVTGTVNDKLTIVGTVWFVLQGKRYVNGDHRVEFRKVT